MSGTPNTVPVVDWQALDRHTMGNAALQRELFILFFGQTPIYVGDLEAAARSGDKEAWGQAAHGIKGSARALGFTRIALLAMDCEKQAPGMELVEELKAALEETRAVVDHPEAA